MRVRFVLLATAFVALVAPAAEAHEGGHANHLSVTVETLAAGANVTYNLAFEEGPFAAGWVFLVYGGVNSETAPLDLVLSTEGGQAVASWQWRPGQFHLNTTRLPVDGEYVLDLRNPSPDEDLQFAFYYDQSCECLDKTLGLSGGWALFNFPLQPDRKVRVEFELWHLDPETLERSEPQGVRSEATVALLRGEDAQWPADFENVTATASLTKRLTLDWTTEEQASYYVWFQVKSGAQPTRPVYVLPTLTVDDAGGGSPGPGLAAALAAMAAIAVARRRHK